MTTQRGNVDLPELLGNIISRLRKVEQNIGNPKVVGVYPSNMKVTSINIGGTPFGGTSTPGIITGYSAAPGTLFDSIYVDLSWTAPTTGTAHHYEVETARWNATLSLYEPSVKSTTSTTALRITGLDRSTTYGVRVTAVAPDGTRGPAYPGAGTYQNFTSGIDSTAPAAPSGLSAAASTTAVMLRWNDNSEIDVANGHGGYLVQYSTSSIFATATTVRSSTTFATISALTPGTTYYFKVAAVDSSGNASSYSSSVSATPGGGSTATDGVVPPVPGSVALTAMLGALYVSWPAVTNVDPVTYEVHISTTTGFAPSGATLAAKTAATIVTLRTDAAGAALAYGTTYYIKIIARDGDGASAASTQVSGAVLQVTGPDISAGSVTASNIAAGTLTSASGVFGAIDAASITTGTLSAARIGADTITAKNLNLSDMTNFAGGSDFENSSAVPWDLTGAVLDTAQAHAGTTSLKIASTSPASPSSVATLQFNPQAKNADVFYVEFWMYRDAAWNGAGNSKLRMANQSNTIISAVGFAAANAPANTWTLRTGTLFVGAGTTSLIFNMTHDATAGNCWIDDVVILRKRDGATLVVDGTITATQIAANTITAAQIAAGTITATQIAAGTITADRLVAHTLTANEIAANTITANEIAANTITAAQIAAGSITATEIATGSITAANIAAGALDAATINAGTLTAGSISSGNIGSSILDSNTLTDSRYIFRTDDSTGAILVYTVSGTTTTTITTTGTGTFVVPAGVTSVKVECWAGGGAGGGSSANGLGPQGGGGGEYARENAYTVTPLASISYQVGAGGTGVSAAAGNVGQDTTFDGTGVVAHGGRGGNGIYQVYNAPGGTGSTNTVHFSGGSGHNGFGSFGNQAGGGGGSAGSTKAGNAGAGSGAYPAGGLGGAAVTGGGAGGNAPNTGGTGTTGVAGGAPGGGGSGAAPGTSARVGGAGGRGQIKLTYGGALVLVASIAAVAGTDASTGASWGAGVQVYGTVVTDWNTTNVPGFYAGGSTATNSPVASGTFSGISLGWPNDTGMTQVVTRLTTGDVPEIWMRNYQTTGGWKTWRRVYDDVSATSGAMTATSGGINSYSFRRVGKIVHFYGVFTTPALTVSAGGNITNTTLATITDTRFIPWSTTALSSGASGDIAAFVVTTGGGVQIVAYPPGHGNVTAGTAVSCGGSWVCAN